MALAGKIRFHVRILFLYFLVQCLLRGTKSQGLWRCSSHVDFGFVFPNLTENDLNPNLWQDSDSGINYVYPLPLNQPNCSGMVSSIQFCYRAPIIYNYTNLVVFNFLVGNLSDNTFNVVRTVPVHSTPNDDAPMNNPAGEDSLPMDSMQMNGQLTLAFCMPMESELYCCDETVLAEDDFFDFPAEGLAIGITFPNSTAAVLQRFQTVDGFQMYTSPSYSTHMNLVAGTAYNVGSLVTNNTFHVLNLRIFPLQLQEITASSTIQEFSTSSIESTFPTANSASSERGVSTFSVTENQESVAPDTVSPSASTSTFLNELFTPSSLPTEPMFPDAASEASYQWRCTNFSEEENVFPNLGGNTPDPSLWQDSGKGLSYVYTIPSDPGNCNGIVSSIEFCYRTNRVEERVTLFNFLALQRGNDSFNVLRSVVANTSGVNNSCMRSGDGESYYCCDISTLNEDEQFPFPSLNLAIGISILNSNNAAVLQEINSSLLQLQNMSLEVYNITGMDENTFNPSASVISNPNLQVLRLHITTPPVDHTTTAPFVPVFTELLATDTILAPAPSVSHATTLSTSNEMASGLSTAEVISASSSIVYYESTSGISVPHQTPTTDSSSFPSSEEETTPLTTGPISNHLWMCADLSEDERIFPNILREGNPDPHLWRDSERGAFYAYNFPVNCNGLVTEMQYCYKIPQSEANVLVFTFLLLQQNNTHFNAVKSIPVYTTNDEMMMCNGSRGSNITYCCNSMMLNEEDRFQFSYNISSFGINIPHSSRAVLQEFNSDFLQRHNMLPRVYNISWFNSSMSIISGAVTDDSRIQVMRLFINPHIPTRTTDPSSPQGEIPSTDPSSPRGEIPLTTSTTNSIRSSSVVNLLSTPTADVTFATSATVARGSGSGVAGVVGGVLGAIIVILIAALVLFMVICSCKMRQSKKTTSPFNGATYSDSTGVSPQGDTNHNLELNVIRNEYVQFGPHAIDGSSNATSQVTVISDSSGQDETTQPDPYSVANEEMPKVVSSENASKCSNPADTLRILQAQVETMFSENICTENIHTTILIKSGQFGDLYEGVWRQPEDKVEVVVKTLKENPSDADKVKFLQELAIVGQLKHANIVSIHGIVKDGDHFQLVMEKEKTQDLMRYLLSMRVDDGINAELDGHELLSYCRQIASGMVYLTNKGLIHNDLAARNILVTDDKICKITDFTMTCELLDDSCIVSEGIEIQAKWAAPEVLEHKKFSIASDIWSFGVVMYEIWSIGHEPLEKISNEKVLEALNAGYRQPPPPGCPRAIYKIMISCWNPSEDSRPDFSEVSLQLSLANSMLLSWLEEDKSNYPEADRLGASLACSESLYQDLQLKYVNISDNNDNLQPVLSE